MPLEPRTKFDERLVERLTKLYRTPQMNAQREQLRKMLAVQEGEIGVDVGCGTGHLACELAREVGPRGRIIAIDASVDMVNTAKALVRDEKLGRQVEVSLGDAIALNIDDHYADFIVASQVYCYIQDVDRAIGEAARVLRNGGRLGVLETDWEMCIYESNDQALTRRIMDGQWRFAHSHLPRRIHRLFRASGLNLVRSDVFPILETHYDPDSFGVGLVDIARDAAVRHGVLAADADAWAADIRSRAVDGEYFFCTNRFIFVATK